MPTRFVMIGGFLGAGKTTTLIQLARAYQAQGKKVGIVTNDQAEDLVDTNLFRAQGFSVEEVAGACFCCRFDDLINRIGKLDRSQHPDIILAEPVGSCTDLVATVIQPLKDLHGMQIEIAPYPVLFKPSHGERILNNQPAGGFSPKAAYIFKKQMEEADAVVINRIDELDPTRLSSLVKLVNEYYPNMPVLKLSAVTGEGLESLMEFLEKQGKFGKKILEIDYDTYAEGEAELGWLNLSCQIKSSQPFDLDSLVQKVLLETAEFCKSLNGEVGHLKLIGMDGSGAFSVGNLVATSDNPRLSLKSYAKPSRAELIVNARVAVDPNVLEREVKRLIDRASREIGGLVQYLTTQSFRPGRPVPTHRYEVAKA